jgi:hypothetical protein
MATRAELRDQIRRLADIEDDGNHISNGEINDDLNSSLAALWATLVDASDGSLFGKLAPVLLTTGNNDFRLPGDFLRLVSVDVLNNTTFVHSTPADAQRWAQLTRTSQRGLGFAQHYLQWNKEQAWYELFIFPKPSDPESVFVRYIPSAPQLSMDAEELGLPADWSRWSVYDVAIKCNIKEETDPAPIMIERDKIERRIINDVKSQSVAQVKSIRDVSSWEDGGRFALPPINYTGGL